MNDFQTTTLEGCRFSFYNKRELDKVVSEIFGDQEYKFTTESKSPFIIDCGAHIGVSILYFKSQYPSSRILAFEPDPLNLELLKMNVQQNNFSDVEIIGKAVGKSEGKAILYREPPDLYQDNAGIRWTWGNRIIPSHNKRSEKVQIQIARLSKYISAQVDFLKIDVEGAEQAVVEDISRKLPYVRRLAIEYHGHNTSRQMNDLNKITSILERAKFSLEIKPKELSTRQGKIDIRDNIALLTGVSGKENAG